MKNASNLFMHDPIIPHVGKTAKCFGALIRSRFEAQKVPLTKEQFIVLMRLENEPQPQSFLAQITERDKGSLTRLVQSLEKKGFVNRKVCKQDSRVNQVAITKSGAAILNKVKPVLLEIFDQLQEGITEEEKQTTLRVLKSIQENSMKELEKLDSIK